MKIYFSQPRPLPEGFTFTKPDIFIGEYGRIIELMFSGVIVTLCVALIVVIIIEMFRK